MKRMCHASLTTPVGRPELAVTELLRNASVITDPKKLAFLKAKAAGVKNAGVKKKARKQRFAGKSSLG